MRQILPPQPRELLMPIVSCLPTAFLSPKPPPALLPLLSPILRQRLTFLSTSIPSPDPNATPGERNSQQTWLKLLTWNPSRAERLVDVVGDMQLEPHPVSGEPELFDDATDPNAAKVHFRRLDQETLHAKCDVPLHKVGVVWVWCVNDSGAVGVDALTATDGEDAWRVAEVRPFADGVDDATEKQERWYDSMAEAEEAFEREEQASYEGLDGLKANGTNGSNGNAKKGEMAEEDEEEEDDSYWAAYDRTPGKTPTPNPKDALGMTSKSKVAQNGAQRNASVTEADYFQQYANVQPAMDAHDPDEEHPEIMNQITDQPRTNQPRPPLESNQSEELLSEHVLQIRRRLETEGSVDASHLQPFAPKPQHAYQQNDDGGEREIHSPSPTRPSSSGSNGRSPITERLEKVATHSDSPPPPAYAENGVKSHVGHEIKSLFRLCKGVGIDRAEFERVVRRELEMLSLMDEE